VKQEDVISTNAIQNQLDYRERWYERLRADVSARQARQPGALLLLRTGVEQCRHVTHRGDRMGLRVIGS